MLETISHLAQYPNQHLLVVGVGNPLRGDDAAGLILGEKVATRLGLAYLCCEEVPENYLGEMLDNPADTILVVDAVDMNAEVGEIKLLPLEELAAESISTHNCSVSLLATVLAGVKGKEMLVLGIQPYSLGWGQDLTAAISVAIERFVAGLPEGNSAAPPQ